LLLPLLPLLLLLLLLLLLPQLLDYSSTKELWSSLNFT
jgi:hypothetical protein